jgi:photosystem II stability/assembly factor-like uncharacterized protein
MHFEVAGSAKMMRNSIRLFYLILIVCMFCCSARAESISSFLIPRDKLTMSKMTASAGQMLTLYTQPQVPEKLWAGTAHGGLWLSVDSGSSWISASVLMNNLAVGSIAAQAGNPDIIYVGTGYAHNSDAASIGQGMFKSDDGGISWKSLPLTRPATMGENWSHVISIATNITGVILAATSDNHRNGFIYRSIDGGQTWGLLPVYAGSRVGPHNVVHKVRFDPDNPDSAIFMDDYANIMHSVDGGATWNVVRKLSTSCK